MLNGPFCHVLVPGIKVDFVQNPLGHVHVAFHHGSFFRGQRALLNEQVLFFFLREERFRLPLFPKYIRKGFQQPCFFFVVQEACTVHRFHQRPGFLQVPDLLRIFRRRKLSLQHLHLIPQPKIFKPAPNHAQPLFQTGGLVHDFRRNGHLTQVMEQSTHDQLFLSFPRECFLFQPFLVELVDIVRNLAGIPCHIPHMVGVVRRSGIDGFRHGLREGPHLVLQFLQVLHVGHGNGRL